MLSCDNRASAAFECTQAGNAQGEERQIRSIRHHIDSHLGDCELSEKAIRQRFNVSRATLYRRFQPLGEVARYIRERRLQLAHRHLYRNPACNLTWLLYEVGFASERQFERAFNARFGMSAAQWRRCCQADGITAAPWPG